MASKPGNPVDRALDGLMLAEFARRNPATFSTGVGMAGLVPDVSEVPTVVVHRAPTTAEQVLRHVAELGVRLEPWQQRALRVVLDGCACRRPTSWDSDVGRHGFSWLGDNCLGREHP